MLSSTKRLWAFIMQLLCLSFLLISCSEYVDSPFPNITPLSIPTPAGLERASATAFVANGKAYLLFGRQEAKSSAALNDCWQFDPNDASWTRKANFPGRGRVSAIAEVVDGKGYVGLGYNSGVHIYSSDTVTFSDFWMYDPLTDDWQQKADFPEKAPNKAAPVAACSSFAYKQWIYVLGLSVDNYVFNEVWRYDTKLDTWEKLANKYPGKIRSAGTSCSDGNRFFFGLGYDRESSSEWWEYFPETDSWKKRKSIPENGRLNASAFAFNNRYFVTTGRRFGGTLTDGKLFDDLLEYDAAKDVWYKRGTLNGARENAIAFVLSNKAYIGFGENEQKRFNDLYCFEP
ncbi:MAG: hypothetical protein AUK44_10770 [Porphyromonadaceae bacterium CG2_30_38_12]|nr:MAG: hypothetical protein AUK44_10770 [Porphyromonadaceae bacterium CG2_30_38_12]